MTRPSREAREAAAKVLLDDYPRNLSAAEIERIAHLETVAAHLLDETARPDEGGV